MKIARWSKWFLLLALSSTLAGCGNTGLPLVPVSGKITFYGGPPPAAGTIGFVSVTNSGMSGTPNRSGAANFGTDGTFVVTSFKKGDGLLPGRYTVNVTCYMGEPSEAVPNSFVDLNAVPRDYHPDLEVKEGSKDLDLVYDVPPKKN